MKTKGIKYRELAQYLNISEPSVKRLLNSGDLTLSRLEKICTWLEMSIIDLLEIAKKETPTPYTFSLSQETYLSKNIQALLLLRALVIGSTLENIRKDQLLPELEFKKILIQLEKLEIIETQVTGKIKLKINWPFRWIKNGPLQRTYLNQIPTTILKEVQSSLEVDSKLKAFELVLSGKSYKKLHLDFLKLLDKYRSIARIENMSLPPDQLKQATGLFAMGDFVVWKTL